jgi:predicted MFS family arabinose efflux permease
MTQGFLVGIALSFIYLPSISLPALWFSNNKAFAVGVVASGSGIGGFVAAPVLRIVMDHVGFRWALIILAMVNGVMGTLAIVLIRMPPDTHDKPPTHLRQYLQSLYASLALFKDAQFTLLFVMGLFVSLGYYVPYFLLAIYAVSVGLTAWQGALLLGVLNGSCALGRIVLGYAADRWGRLNMLILALVTAALGCLVIWTFSTSFGMLLLFSGVFGIGISGVTIASVICADLFGLDKLATVTGLQSTSYGITTLVGTPLATVMISATQSYVLAILFSGGMILLGASAVVIIRFRIDRRLLVAI